MLYPSVQNPTFGQQVLELPSVTTVELQTGLGSKDPLNIQVIVVHSLHTSVQGFLVRTVCSFPMRSVVVVVLCIVS
jgi:hypothetical protein